jgi:hypothetical protein
LNRFCPKKQNWNRSVWTGFGFFLIFFQFDYFFLIKTVKIITPTLDIYDRIKFDCNLI